MAGRVRVVMACQTAARSLMRVACVGATASLAPAAMEFRTAEKCWTRAACAGAATPPASAATACPTGPLPSLHFTTAIPFPPLLLHPNSGKKIDDCGVCGGSGGCLAPLRVWSNNRMCINSTRMQLQWQLAVNSSAFYFSVLTTTQKPSALVFCSFDRTSFPLASPTGTCLMNSYESDDPVLSPPCSCTTQTTFSAVGSYKVDTYVNEKAAVAGTFDVAVGPDADACGVCGGDNSTCAGCDGVPNRSPTIPPLHNRNPLFSSSHTPQQRQSG